MDSHALFLKLKDPGKRKKGSIKYLNEKFSEENEQLHLKFIFRKSILSDQISSKIYGGKLVTSTQQNGNSTTIDSPWNWESFGGRIYPI